MISLEGGQDLTKIHPYIFQNVDSYIEQRNEEFECSTYKEPTFDQIKSLKQGDRVYLRDEREVDQFTGCFMEFFVFDVTEGDIWIRMYFTDKECCHYRGFAKVYPSQILMINDFWRSSEKDVLRKSMEDHMEHLNEEKNKDQKDYELNYLKKMGY